MGSIKKELLSGVFYTAIAKYSGILISLIITGVLARLISPDKFGIVAVVTGYHLFLQHIQRPRNRSGYHTKQGTSTKRS